MPAVFFFASSSPAFAVVSAVIIVVLSKLIDCRLSICKSSMRCCVVSSIDSLCCLCCSSRSSSPKRGASFCSQFCSEEEDIFVLKTNLSLVLLSAFALSRAETKKCPLSLFPSLSRKGNARKERKKERKKERRQREEEMRAKSVCRKKSGFSFSRQHLRPDLVLISDLTDFDETHVCLLF